MLNNFGDLKNEILVRLDASTSIAYYTDTILGDWINDAYKWAGAYHKWPITEYMDSSTLFVGSTDNYAYPSNFKSKSIRWVKDGNGEYYDKKNFTDYLKYMKDVSSGKDKIFSDFGRLFYINPNIATGTLYVWGQITIGTLDKSDPTVTTLFSNGDEEGNEAIVLETLSYAKTKEHKSQESDVYHKKAIETLEMLWKRFKDEEFEYQTKDRGMFKRFDVLRGGMRDELLRRDQWF